MLLVDDINIDAPPRLLGSAQFDYRTAEGLHIQWPRYVEVGLAKNSHLREISMSYCRDLACGHEAASSTLILFLTNT